MTNLSTEFLLVFTPLFVAFDVFAILPIFMSVSMDMTEFEKRRLATQACLTAFIVAIAFLLTGKFIFNFIGISEDDLRVGGGILLFMIALSDLVFAQEEKRRAPGSELAIVPIGIPLILGPASLTTILILTAKHGQLMTLAGVVINVFIVWLVFFFSKYILRVLGRGGAMALGKIASLFLLAISVLMIRTGIFNFIQNMQ